MDLGPNADGELLQRALDGEPVSDPGVLELVAVLHAVSAVDQAALAPRAEFVAGLRDRLMADDPTVALPGLPGAPGVPDPDADPSDGEADRKTSVVRIAARPVRYLAAAAASILLLGGLLGVASRSSAPGDALYGIKQVLDRVAVQLAGSRYDQGVTYLAQAQQHLDETRDLLDRGTASPTDIDAALDAASDATTQAQTLLVGAYHQDQRADALSELADFYARAIPQVDAMQDRVPASSIPAWQRLRDLLGAGQAATLRELATCSACGDRAAAARQLLATLTGGAGGAGVGGATEAVPGAAPSAPGGAAPRGSGSQRPTAAQATGVPGIRVTGGVTLPGATANLPSVGVTSGGVGAGGGGITLPGATASLPGVGVSSGGVGVGGGGITVPGGPTASLPSASLPLPTKPVP